MERVAELSKYEQFRATGKRGAPSWSQSQLVKGRELEDRDVKAKQEDFRRQLQDSRTRDFNIELTPQGILEVLKNFDELRQQLKEIPVGGILRTLNPLHIFKSFSTIAWYDIFSFAALLVAILKDLVDLFLVPLIPVGIGIVLSYLVSIVAAILITGWLMVAGQLGKARAGFILRKVIKYAVVWFGTVVLDSMVGISVLPLTAISTQVAIIFMWSERYDQEKIDELEEALANEEGKFATGMLAKKQKKLEELKVKFAELYL